MKLTFVQRLALTVLAVVFAASAQAQANPGYCGLHSLSGSYAFKNIGKFPDGTDSLFMGVDTFDGAGNISSVETGSVGGVVFPGVTKGTYTVKQDCTGTFTFHVVNPQGQVVDIHWYIVIADNGKTIYGMISDSGWVYSSEHRKQ
jgi:hypothetical protein